MMRKMCRAKIHRATVTDSQIDYEGSIEIDSALMEAAGLYEYEVVLVANIANGARFETYVIKGPENSGAIGLRGAAAHLGKKGDKLIIMSMALLEDAQSAKLKPVFVYVNDKNQIERTANGIS